VDEDVLDDHTNRAECEAQAEEERGPRFRLPGHPGDDDADDRGSEYENEGKQIHGTLLVANDENENCDDEKDDENEKEHAAPYL
jgi:hypothetical protein